MLQDRKLSLNNFLKHLICRQLTLLNHFFGNFTALKKPNLENLWDFRALGLNSFSSYCLNAHCPAGH